MSRDQVFDTIAHIACAHVLAGIYCSDVGEIKEHTAFKELGFDCFDINELICESARSLKITVEPSELHRSTMIEPSSLDQYDVKNFSQLTDYFFNKMSKC